MFSSFEPDNPYRIQRQIEEAEEEARESVLIAVTRLFEPGQRGYRAIAQIVDGGVSIDIGIRQIKKMIRACVNEQ